MFDPEGFQSTWGPRVTERRHELYNYSCHHECLWNAPTWPYETSRLLTGLANLLNDYPPNVSSMTKQSFWQLLLQFVRAHMQSTIAFPFDTDGNAVPEHPWIGEDLHPDLGYWVARDKMHRYDVCWLPSTSLLLLQPSHLRCPLQVEHDRTKQGLQIQSQHIQ